MYVPELFGPAPTLIHDDIAGTGQPYGSSSLPGAPVSPIVPATVSTIYNIPDISIPTPSLTGGIPWHTGGLAVAPTTAGSDSPTGGRHFAAPTGPASDVSVPSTPTTSIQFASPDTTTTPATTTAKPAGAETDTNDVFGKLIALAGSQQGGGGGGGGLVALPTGMAEASGASGGGGISKATLFFLIAAIAIGVYFYSRHKKKGGEKGAEKKE